MSAANEHSSEEQIHELSEQVKLQVGAYEAMAEVYEKYSLALARIMELLRQLHDGIKNNDENVDSHFSEIITCVTVVGEGIRHAEEAIRLDNSIIAQKFTDFIVLLEKVLNKVESHGNDVSEIRKTLNEFYNTFESQAAPTLEMVRELHAHQQKQQDFWKRWRIWFYTLIGLIGLLESLIQFGVLQLTWFK